VAVIKNEHYWFWCNSCHAKFRMYQTQTVTVKNLNAVAASRCPVRWIIVYKIIVYKIKTYAGIYIQCNLDCKDQKIPESLQPFDYIHTYICVHTHGNSKEIFANRQVDISLCMLQTRRICEEYAWYWFKLVCSHNVFVRLSFVYSETY
jgi:hypothetical protein